MTDTSNIKRLYLEGLSPFELEKLFNISQGKLNTILSGVRRSHSDSLKLAFIRKSKHRFKEIIKLFNSGMSVNAISKSAGLQRNTINRILEINGISPRSQSEAEKLKWSQMSMNQKRKQTIKARKAIAKKGFDHLSGPETIKKAAETRAINKKFIGAGETEFLKWIKERKYPAIPQAGIHSYNIDILIGDLAVEIHNCTTAPHLMKSARKKIEYLLNAGINVLYIKIKTKKGIDIQKITSDYAITFFEEIRSNPTFIPQYRMIRGNGEFMASGCLKNNHLSVIPSPN